jgi:manganese-dependent ADP-ribose/CDP-alcohol diphosphatase
VLVCTHVPLHTCCTKDFLTAWNADDVLAVLHRWPHVVACMCGHDHDGGRGVDACGVHHVCLQAVLCTPPGRDCYAAVDLYADRIEVCGVDLMQSAVLPLNERMLHAFDADAAPAGAPHAVAVAVDGVRDLPPVAMDVSQ